MHQLQKTRSSQRFGALPHKTPQSPASESAPLVSILIYDCAPSSSSLVAIPKYIGTVSPLATKDAQPHARAIANRPTTNHYSQIPRELSENGDLGLWYSTGQMLVAGVLCRYDDAQRKGRQKSPRRSAIAPDSPRRSAASAFRAEGPTCPP